MAVLNCRQHEVWYLAKLLNIWNLKQRSSRKQFWDFKDPKLLQINGEFWVLKSLKPILSKNFLHCLLYGKIFAKSLSNVLLCARNKNFSPSSDRPIWKFSCNWYRYAHHNRCQYRYRSVFFKPITDKKKFTDPDLENC